MHARQRECVKGALLRKGRGATRVSNDPARKTSEKRPRRIDTGEEGGGDARGGAACLGRRDGHRGFSRERQEGWLRRDCQLADIAGFLRLAEADVIIRSAFVGGLTSGLAAARGRPGSRLRIPSACGAATKRASHEEDQQQCEDGTEKTHLFVKGMNGTRLLFR